MATSTSFTGSFGGFNSYTPIVPTGPAAPYTAAGSAKESDSESSSSKGTSLGGLDSKMVEWLYKEGLASDVESFLVDMEYAINHAYNPITGKPNLGMYQLMLPKLADIKNQKEQFSKAMDELRSKDALGEYALTQDGSLIVKDANGQIATRKYTELVEGDRVITNGDLAKTRMQDKQAAWNMDITNILANGTSVQAITQYLNDAVKKLGATSMESIQEYPNVQQQQLQQGIGQLQNVVNGTIKVEQMNSTQQEQYKMALNYLLSTLPGNMRMLLDIKGAENKMSADQLVQSWLGAQVSQSGKQSQTLSGFSSTNANGGSGGGKDDSDKMSEASQWLNGLGERGRFIIQKGTKDALAVPANVMSIQNSNGNIGITTLDHVGNSEFGGMLDLHSVSMGDSIIPFSNLGDILVDGNGLYKMELPYDVAAYQNTGVIKPDLSWLPKIQEAERQIDKLKCRDDVNKMNEIYEGLGIPVKYQDGRKTLTAQYRIFGVLNGYTTNNVFGDDEFSIDKDYVKEITNENTIQNIMNMINKGAGSDNEKTFNNSYLSWNKDHMYESAVFIPVRNNYFNSIAGQSNLPTINDALFNKEPLQQQRDRLANARITGEKP